MLLNRWNYFVNASPLIFIFGASLDHTEALQNIYDVIDSASLHFELLCALVQEQKSSLWGPIEEEESSAELAKAFLLSVVCHWLTWCWPSNSVPVFAFIWFDLRISYFGVWLLDLNVHLVRGLRFHCYCKAILGFLVGLVLGIYPLDNFWAFIRAFTYLLAALGLVVAQTEIFLILGLENALNFQIFNCHWLDLICWLVFDLNICLIWYLNGWFCHVLQTLISLIGVIFAPIIFLMC